MALLSFLDKFVQLLADERREVEVVVLNPLVLVFPNGDCLSFHRNARYARYTYKYSGRHGPVGLQQSRVRAGDDGVDETRSVSFPSRRNGVPADSSEIFDFRDTRNLRFLGTLYPHPIALLVR